MRYRVSSVLIFAMPLFISACATSSTEKQQQAVAVKAEAEAVNAPGIAEAVIGDAQIQSADTKQVTPLQPGQKIQAKDKVITGKGAKVKLVMKDKNELHVAPETKMEVETYDAGDKKKVLLNLIRGKIRAQVREKYGANETFKIKTPVAVSGVRGTDFIAGYSEDKSLAEIVTFDGAVEFGQVGPDDTIRNPVTVQPGQISKAVQDLPPTQPKALSQTELEKYKAESTVAAVVGAEAQEALKWLKNGNLRFVKQQMRRDGQSKKDVARVAKAQKPHAIVMGCSDSRIPPEIVFDQKLGEIFVIRSTTMDQSAIAAAEQAANQFGVKLLIILGHTPDGQNDPWEKPESMLSTLEKSPVLNQVNIQTAIYDLNTGAVKFQ